MRWPKFNGQVLLSCWPGGVRVFRPLKHRPRGRTALKSGLSLAVVSSDRVVVVRPAGPRPDSPHISVGGRWSWELATAVTTWTLIVLPRGLNEPYSWRPDSCHFVLSGGFFLPRVYPVPHAPLLTCLLYGLFIIFITITPPFPVGRHRLINILKKFSLPFFFHFCVKWRPSAFSQSSCFLIIISLNVYIPLFHLPIQIGIHAICRPEKKFEFWSIFKKIL